MTIKYSTQQIKMLLALQKKQLTKTAFSQRFRGLAIADRYALLAQLIDDGLVSSEERPTPNAKHVPVYYFLTPAGKQWVATYLKRLKA